VSELFTTPLNAWHKAQGAKMAPFAGWDMPIQYAGILAEHQHTRTAASLFDICHMGEFLLKGAGAAEALGRIATQDLSTLAPGKCRYGFLCNEQGGVLDDCIVYRFEADSFMLVVNGACAVSDYQWIGGHLPSSLKLEDISAATAKIDLQGPLSLDVVERVFPPELAAEIRQLKYFSLIRTTWRGRPLIVSRTGYTGELGYELYVAWDQAEELWTTLLTDARAKPAGLGARDTLRLEMGYPQYGHDLDDKHTPTEAGYAGMLTSAADYIGKAGAAQVRETLVPLAIAERRSARHQDQVLSASGELVGVVTSGSFAPSLGHSIALAFIKAEAAEATEFVIKTGRAELKASRTEPPFYKQGTARRKI
jgi:aminomethyltransferase